MKKQLYYLTIFMVIISINLKAQNSGPNAPEAMSFEPVDATDMVNLLTGDFTYVLPLMEVPGPNGGYPIVLNYHAGVVEDMEASWVGLGWNINPGALNRSINGNPDDLKSGELQTFRHMNAVTSDVKYLAVNSPFPAIPIGLHGTWGDYKSIGGSISLFKIFSVGLDFGEGGNRSMTLGVGTSIAGNSHGGIGIGASITMGTNGVSGGVGIGASIGGDKGPKSALGSGWSGGVGSIGVSFSSKGVSSSVNTIGMTQSSSQAVLSNRDLGYASSGFDVNLIWIQFGQKKEKYWLDKVTTDYTYGILYSRDAQKKGYMDGEDKYWGAQAYNTFMDVSPSPYNKEAIEPDKAELYNNLILAGYDAYNVSAQGLNGSISPRLDSEFLLAGQGRVISNYDDPDPNNWYDNIKSNIHYCYTSMAFLESCKESKSINYYFTRLNESYFASTPGSFSHNGTTTDGDPLSDKFIYSGSYKDATNSLKASNYIQWFTNSEIATGFEALKSKGFIETSSLAPDASFSNSRSNPALFDPSGIGAYIITSPDGKTYHYSLPVYQFEQVMQINMDANNSVEQRRLNKYAYSWLLTGITGPDYVDVNLNGLLDDADYGYWVSFNYGKWADGFMWQKPYIKEKDTDPLLYGRKQVYYLNTIETKSHMALFVKDVRKDGHGKDFSIPLTSYLDKTREIPDEVKGNNYPLYKQFANDIILKGDLSSYKKVEIGAARSLKLNNILLLTKSEYNSITTTQANNLLVAEQSGNIDFSVIYTNVKLKDDKTYFSQLTGFPSFGSSQDYANHGGYSYTNYYYSNLLIERRSSFKNHYNNLVLDVNDPQVPDYTAKALKVIDFTYDETSPVGYGENSEYSNKGKLTLEKIDFKGYGGVSFMPPYIFDYNRLDRSDFDDWGYEKDHPENNSLNSITTPVGTQIIPEFESDVITSEAISKTYGQFILPIIEQESTGYFENTKEYLNYKLHIGVSDYHKNKVFTANNIKIEGLITLTFLATTRDHNPYIDPIIIDLGTRQDFLIYFNADKTEVIIEYPKLQEFPFLYDEYSSLNQLSSDIYVYFKELNYIGGGLRVKNIEVTDGLTSQHTSYSYDNGATSFIPMNNEQYIPYLNLLPSPGVYYGSVTVSNEDANGNILNKVRYKFNVPGFANYNNKATSYSSNLLEVADAQNETKNLYYDDPGGYSGPSDVSFRVAKVIDKTSALGRLESQFSLNNNNEVLATTYYHYKQQTPENMKSGVFQENFYSLKRYQTSNEGHTSGTSDWHYNNTNKVEYASVLESVVTTVGNHTSTTKYIYDLETGEANEIYTVNSKGDSYKAITIPAYTIPAYDNMGMKSDDINYKNMLVQPAASLNYKLTGTDATNTNHWSVLGASIQTWKGSWENYAEWNAASAALVYNGKDAINMGAFSKVIDVWRKHKTFAWQGTLDANGAYANFGSYDTPAEIMSSNFAGWANPDYAGAGDNTNGWKKTSEVVRYDHYSSPVEVKDINGDFAASKKDPDNYYTTVSAANASYVSFAATGFEKRILASENPTFEYLYEGEIHQSAAKYSDNRKISYNQNAYDPNTMIQNVFAHTGDYYLAVNNGTIGPKYTASNSTLAVLTSGCDYRASVWVHKNSPGSLNLRATVGATNYTNETYMGTYGDWKLYYLDFPVAADATTFTVWADATGAVIYVDDFRVAPFESAVTSYTYDNAGQVTAIINNDNFATKYEYDKGGRLVGTFRETQDGFERVSSHKYNNANMFRVNYELSHYPGGGYELDKFTKFGGKLYFQVSNSLNENWSYTKPSWVTEISRGTDYLELSISPNSLCNARSGSISFTTNNYEQSFNVNQEYNQDGGAFQFSNIVPNPNEVANERAADIVCPADAELTFEMNCHSSHGGNTVYINGLRNVLFSGQTKTRTIKVKKGDVVKCTIQQSSIVAPDYLSLEIISISPFCNTTLGAQSMFEVGTR